MNNILSLLMQLDIASRVLNGVGTAIGGLPTTLLGIGTGMLTNWLTNRNQLNQNNKLIEQQKEYSQDMTEYNKNTQLDLWNKTNYSAQLEQMKKAGINPALIWSKGAGAGGSTAVNTVAMQQPNVQGNAGLSIENQQRYGQTQEGLDQNIKQSEATIDNIMKDTDLKMAQKGLTTSQQVLNNIEGYIKDHTKEESINFISRQVALLDENVHIASSQRWVQENNAVTYVERAKAELAGVVITNELNKTGIGMHKQQIENLRAVIAQNWASIAIDKQNAQTNWVNAITNQLNSKTLALNGLTQERMANISRDRLGWEKGIHDMTDSQKEALEGMLNALSMGMLGIGKLPSGAIVNPKGGIGFKPQ